jgi:hypothetical protein
VGVDRTLALGAAFALAFIEMTLRTHSDGRHREPRGA